MFLKTPTKNKEWPLYWSEYVSVVMGIQFSRWLWKSGYIWLATQLFISYYFIWKSSNTKLFYEAVGNHLRKDVLPKTTVAVLRWFPGMVTQANLERKKYFILLHKYMPEFLQVGG